MRRLFFLVPDTNSCQAIVNELQDSGIPERHLHVIASIEQALDGLPEANILQKTELIHGIEKGAGLGGTAGVLGGLLAMAFPPAGIVLGGGALLAGAVAGAGFGAVVSATLACHRPDRPGAADARYQPGDPRDRESIGLVRGKRPCVTDFR